MKGGIMIPLLVGVANDIGVITASCVSIVTPMAAPCLILFSHRSSIRKLHTMTPAAGTKRSRCPEKAAAPCCILGDRGEMQNEKWASRSE